MVFAFQSIDFLACVLQGNAVQIDVIVQLVGAIHQRHQSAECSVTIVFQPPCFVFERVKSANEKTA